MNISEISSDDFKELEDKEGLYLFIMNDCFLCQQQIETLEKLNYNKDFYIINCLEDTDYYMQEMNLDDLPYSIVYKNNEIVFEKGGVFFDKQLNELKKFL